MAQAAVKSVMFVWEGRDKQGKKIKGEMSGTSDALVKAMLRRQGINPMRVKKKPMPLFGGGGKSINWRERYRHIQPSARNHDVLRRTARAILRDRRQRPRESKHAKADPRHQGAMSRRVIIWRDSPWRSILFTSTISM